MTNSRQATGDSDRGSALRNHLQGSLNRGFGLVNLLTAIADQNNDRYPLPHDQN